MNEGTDKSAKSAKSAKKESQINTQVQELNGLLDHLSAGVEKLEELLNPVLSAPLPVETSGKDEVELVPLADRIRNGRRAINKIADQVYNIIKRLEL